jgi:hypothetical protein
MREVLVTIALLVFLAGWTLLTPRIPVTMTTQKGGCLMVMISAVFLWVLWVWG